VGMTEEFQVLNLSPDLADNIQILDFLSIKNFYGNFVPSQLVFTD
jgi:hypothetical protein